MHTNICTFFICLFPIFVFSQGSFNTIGATWKYEFHTLDCNDAFVVYSIENEITVNGKSCHVINAYTSYDGSVYEKHMDSLIVWEDRAQVYFVHEDSFYLLYDFDLLIGDTLDYFIPKSSEVFSIVYDSVYLEPVRVNLSVLEIDTVYRNGREHVLYDTYYAGVGPDAYQMGRIIRGIGSGAQTIVGQQGFFAGEGCGGFMHCHKTDVVQWGDGTTCDTLSNTVEHVAIADLNIYPNPIESELYISNWEQIESYQIINLQGQTIETKYLESEVVILSSLNSGIYFILLKTSNSKIVPITIMKI